MLKALSKKESKVNDRYQNNGQEGFTLVELLGSLVIVGILISIFIAVLPDFGAINGTELRANSQDVENAIIQDTLNDDLKEFSAVYGSQDAPEDNEGTALTDHEGEAVTQAYASATLASVITDNTDFKNPNQAATVLEHVAEDNGITPQALSALVRPVDVDEIDRKVPSGVDLGTNVEAKYYVVVKKAQLYKDEALAFYNGYNDGLAGKVFSFETVIDGEGVYYNGSFEIKDAEEDADASTVFATPSDNTKGGAVVTP